MLPEGRMANWQMPFTLQELLNDRQSLKGFSKLHGTTSCDSALEMAELDDAPPPGQRIPDSSSYAACSIPVFIL
jgi:hypothetical protein